MPFIGTQVVDEAGDGECAEGHGDDRGSGGIIGRGSARPSAAAELSVRQTKTIKRFLKGSKSSANVEVLRALQVMDIPIDRHGDVRFVDCVYGLSRLHYDIADSGVVERFAERGIVTNVASCFKVHHAFAIRKLVRLLRKRLEKRKALLRSGGASSIDYVI